MRVAAAAANYRRQSVEMQAASGPRPRTRKTVSNLEQRRRQLRALLASLAAVLAALAAPHQVFSVGAVTITLVEKPPPPPPQRAVNSSLLGSTQIYAPNHRMADYEVAQLITSQDATRGQNQSASVVAAAPAPNATSRDMAAAESLLRPQVAVQIYTAGAKQANETREQKKQQQQQPARVGRKVLKGKRTRASEGAASAEANGEREYQAASSKQVGLWHYEPSGGGGGEQQSIDLHQLDGNSFALAGPTINAIISVPMTSESGNGGAELRSRAPLGGAAAANQEDEQQQLEQEEQLARNISATSVERAISHLLDSQASGNLEFNMNMNGDEIVLNPVGRQAGALLATSLPSAGNSNQDSQVAGESHLGEPMMRQHSHQALVDAEEPPRAGGGGGGARGARVKRRLARLLKGDAEQRRSQASRRQNVSASAAEPAEKRPDNGDAAAAADESMSENSSNSDDSSDDDDDEREPANSAAKRSDDDDDDAAGDLDNEPSTPAVKTKQARRAKRFRSSASSTVARPPAAGEDRSQRAQEADDELLDGPSSAFTRPAARAASKRPQTGKPAFAASRRRFRKRRTNFEADNQLASGAERTASIYGGGGGHHHRKRPTGGRSGAAEEEDGAGGGQLVIKGDDVRRFEQLLENLRSMVDLTGARHKAQRAAKTGRASQGGRDEPAAAAGQQRETAPSRRHLQTRPPAGSSARDADNCDKLAARKRHEQLQSADNQPSATLHEPADGGAEREAPTTAASEDDGEGEQGGRRGQAGDSRDSRDETDDGQRPAPTEASEEGGGAGGGDESSLDQGGERGQAGEENQRNDDMALDESDTNLSQQKVTVGAPKTSGQPNALYVRKTILQSYYDNNNNSNGGRESQPDGANKLDADGSSSRAATRRPETSARPETRRDSGPSFDDKSAEEDGQRAERKEAASVGKKQQAATSKDAYIDYDRLDDREVFRGSESQKVRVLVPADGRSLRQQLEERGRTSDSKIPYAPPSLGSPL